MPAVVTSIEKPASVTVISQEVAVVVVSLLHASETGKASIGETVVCPLLFLLLPGWQVTKPGATQPLVKGDTLG